MSSSFFNFSKQKLEPKVKEEVTKNLTDEKKAEINSAYEKYSNMNDGDLMQNLYKEVARQKQNGTFDIKKLESAVDSLGGLLSPEQKKNIKEILNQIK